MHPRAAEFRDRVREEYGLDVEIEEFPEGTKTAADAADAVDCAVGQIVKSLVFEVDDEVVVVATSGANRVAEARLAAHFGTDAGAVGMADPETIRETVGWSIGGVPPLCHDADVPMLFDRTLTTYEEVWAAAGTPESVFRIDSDTLLALTGAERAVVAD